MADVCVDLTMLKTLLQVVVYCLITDLTNQCQIRDTDLFLLCALENSAFYGAFPARTLCGIAPACGSILFATCSLRDSLEMTSLADEEVSKDALIIW